MKDLKELIEKMNILNDYQKKIKELSDENFNIFKICGVNHYENTHSSILAELLRNDSSHSFGNKFLEAFFETLKKEKKIDDNFNFYMTNVRVITEYSIPNGRFDIMIENGNQCIIIENKIYANDQFEQLKRYDSFASNKYRDQYHLLYLTLWGNDASDHSGKGINYIQISYQETIVNWLERCVEIAARKSIIRETLIQYINHINSLTNKNSNYKMEEDIIKLLCQPENLEATFTIANNFDRARNYLVNKVFLPQLLQVCNDLKLECKNDEFDRVNTPCARFSILNPDWNYFKIGFEFEVRGLRSLIIGINHKDVKIRNEDTFNELKKHFKKNNKSWVYSDFPKYNNWDENAMKAIINKEMASVFQTELKKILEITKDLEKRNFKL